jgi:hypothetical protein
MITLPEKIRLCAVANGTAYCDEAEFPVRGAPDGFWRIDIFSRAPVERADMRALLKLKTPVAGYYLRGTFVPARFAVAKQWLGTAHLPKPFWVDESVRDFDLCFFFIARQRLFYVKRASPPVPILLAKRAIDANKIPERPKQATPEMVYALGCYSLALAEERRKALAESVPARIEAALSVAGAKLVEWKPVGRGFIDVTWEFLEERFVSTVKEENLRVFNAGICLAGSDARQTLASMPAVAKYAIEQEALVKTRDA